MENDSQDIDPIIVKYIREEQLSKFEQDALAAWIARGEERETMLKHLKKNSNDRLRELGNLEEVGGRIWDKVLERIQADNSRTKDPIVAEPIYNEVIPNASSSKIITDVRLINKTLLKLARKDLTHIHKMEPREFEFLVAELLDEKGYQVEITPQSRDWGKDLIATKHIDFGKLIFYVECKRYEPSRPVGIEVVQRLEGVISGEATMGLIVTSSDFSKPAIDYTTRKLAHLMNLVNYIELCEWIKK